ncbi:unnamed protein product [Rotaria sp. Silwood1]|nr:unnamed protein product [Rotaria sp. Silwood1]
MCTFIEHLPRFDNLKFLRINGRSITNDEESKAFHQIIAELPFTSPFSTRLKNIEIYIPNMMPYYGYILKPNPLSMLERFSISSICLDDLAIILTWMPRIKFLKILYTFMINDEDGQFHEHDLTSRSLMQMPAITTLRQLDIGICDGITCKVNYLV